MASLKRTESPYVLQEPEKRPLKIFSSDPMLGSLPGNRITVEIATEKLEVGPRGERVEVIDYDGCHDRFYSPVNLDDRRILMQGVLEPTESDPMFHQQMVYAGTQWSTGLWNPLMSAGPTKRGRPREPPTEYSRLSFSHRGDLAAEMIRSSPSGWGASVPLAGPTYERS